MSAEIVTYSVTELAEAYRAGSVDPVQVAEAFLDRIERFDGKVAAFCLLDRATTLAAARESARRFSAGAPRGPFDGIPVAVKDLLATRDWPTRRGSLTVDPAGPWPDDSPAIARLRNGGAVFLGKTTTPEFGWKGVTDSPLSGVTANPWDLSLSAGGSSGGSAAAVALRMAPVAIGTDGGGSIRIPASLSGIFGLKPSFGTVAQWPASAFGFVAHVGPMARTVDDAERLLRAMAGPDERDPTALATPLPAAAASRIGLRVGYSPDFGYVDVDREVAAVVARGVDMLVSAGLAVDRVDVGFSDPTDTFHHFWFSGAARLLRQLGDVDRSAMDPGLLEIADVGSGYSDADGAFAQLDLETLREAMSALFRRVDILLTPTLRIASIEAGREVPLGSEARHWTDWTPFTYPFNLTGHPAASIPIGATATGLPIGLQIVGRPGEDLQVLDVARLVEESIPEVTAKLPPLAGLMGADHRRRR